MKSRIIVSMIVIVFAISLVLGGTLAEFSSTAEHSGNTFTAGTLALQLASGSSTSAAWVSPANWAPGESFTGTLNFTNTGSINAKHIYTTFKDYGGYADFKDRIIITGISEKYNDTVVDSNVNRIDRLIGNGDKKLTLGEMLDHMFVSFDDVSGDGIILKANNQNDYSLILTFKFDQDAGNDFQGQAAWFTLEATATQNSPGGGVSLH